MMAEDEYLALFEAAQVNQQEKDSQQRNNNQQEINVQQRGISREMLDRRSRREISQDLTSINSVKDDNESNF